MDGSHEMETSSPVVTEDSHCMFEMEIAAPASPAAREAAAGDDAASAVQEESAAAVITTTGAHAGDDAASAVQEESKMMAAGDDAAPSCEKVIITPGAYAGEPKLVEGPRHPDGNREIRSMILAALPMPPMPVLACKELPDEHSFVDSELKAISSHDLIAHLMNISCTVVSAEKNEQRQRLQWKLQEEMFRQLDEWQAVHDPKGAKQLLPPPEFGYALLSEFTRLYVQSYMPDPAKPQDVRFLFAGDVDKTHVVWKKALEFQRAQDVLYGPCTFGKLEKKFQDMEYAELVQHSVRRILASGQLS